MADPGTSKAQKNPTVIDVARVAGVSVGTVSHVLSGAQRVRPQTRLRVELAVAELGFRPNQLARALVRDETKTIGMVIPDVANPFFAEMVRGAEDVLGTNEYAALLGNSDNDVKKERRYLNSLRERRVDGLIVAIASETDAAEVFALATVLPTVIVDRSLPGWTGDSVSGDNVAGMALAIGHLIGGGHKSIALVSGDPRVSTARERQAGFERALSDAGLQPAAISEGPFTFESGYQQAMTLLGATHRPSAVCAANDLLALGVLSAAAELEIAVPANLSVVGFDDIAYARLAAPALTTIRQPAYGMGEEAARLLLDRLDGHRGARRRIVMLPELVVRRSTAPVSSTDDR